MAIHEMTITASLCQNKPELKSPDLLQIIRESHEPVAKILLSDLFTEPASDAPICDGYEHSLSTSE